MIWLRDMEILWILGGHNILWLYITILPRNMYCIYHGYLYGGYFCADISGIPADFNGTYGTMTQGNRAFSPEIDTVEVGELDLENRESEPNFTKLQEVWRFSWCGRRKGRLQRDRRWKRQVFQYTMGTSPRWIVLVFLLYDIYLMYNMCFEIRVIL